MRIALVTNCTNRKALPPACRAASIGATTLQTFAHEWRQRVKESDVKLPARELYLGRGFQEARYAWAAAAAMGEADLYIASAGLGIVSANDKIPAYSITVADRGEDSVVCKLDLDDAAAWWDGLTAGRRGLLARCGNADLIVVALSAPYLRMMRQELAAVAKAKPESLRLISRRDPGLEDEALRSSWLAYDERLNGRNSPFAGAESDFAQRALRHFVEYVLPEKPNARARAHADAVQTALCPLSKPRKRLRERMTDKEIVALMREIGVDVGSSRMLRILRDERNVACEQSRSSALFQRAFGPTRHARPQSKGRDAKEIVANRQSRAQARR